MGSCNENFSWGRKELALRQHELSGRALLRAHYGGYDTGIILTPVVYSTIR